jgi:glycosyltransferase involved in cell wall biosynthesis
MPKIKVLHLMNNFSDSSISRIVLRLVQNIGTQDFDWHISALSDMGTLQQEFAKSGCRVLSFTNENNGMGNHRQKIRGYIKNQGIEIIHTHTPRTILDAALAAYGLQNLKHIATKHLLNAPSDRRWGMAFTLWDRLNLYIPDKVVAVSQTMYEEIVLLPLINRNRIMLIRNAIPNELFNRPQEREMGRHELGLATDTILIGYTGRIDKVKRIDLLLQAFAQIVAQYPKARLVIAGNGKLRQQMEALSQQLDLSHAVTWMGFYQNIPRLLAAIDIYAQTSVNEGLSLSILEAMAAGKPVVATDVGGAREIISNEKNGLLIPAESEEAIVGAIKNPSLSHAIGQSGKNHVENDFSLSKMVNEYRVVYENLVARNKTAKNIKTSLSSS